MAVQKVYVDHDYVDAGRVTHLLDPAADQDAATKAYVDSLVAGYTFTQGTPSALWTIVHNLGRHPSVTVVDSGGTEIVGDIHYTSPNQLEVSFSAGFSGVAYLN